MSALEPADWDEFRSLGKQMIDDIVDHLSGLRDQSVWQSPPHETRALLMADLPQTGTDPRVVYEQFRTQILPFSRGNTHPRFWGWVNGSGVPIAMYADLLASVMNSTVGSGENGAMLVERQVIAWLARAFDWPADGSGLLTSGCSMGQIIALAAARQVHTTNRNVRTNGLAEGERLTIYGSTETHHSIEKAIELLGIGSAHFRRIPVDEGCRINLVELRETIHDDRRKGLRPFAIVGNVGTVNTGAIDPLDELHSLARQEGLWLHLDGAFGAFAYLLPSHRELLSTMHKADSLVFDLHKWLYLPFDISCVLVRSPAALLDTFRSHADYISATTAGPSAYTHAYSDMGIEQSRRFRALKVWFAVKTHGMDAFRDHIEKNVKQIEHLAMLVETNEKLEVVSRSRLNILCFRFITLDADDEQLNILNERILTAIQEAGSAMPSHTMLDGKFVIRVANNNHRTELSDMDYLVAKVVAVGSTLTTKNAIR